MSYRLSIVFSVTAQWPHAGLGICMLNKDSILRVSLILHKYDNAQVFSLSCLMMRKNVILGEKS